MATQTTNYGLTKPSYNETADIGVINSNMDIIDAKMKAIENKAGSGGGGGNTDTYGHVKVGSVTINASGNDTIELVAGSNVTLTPDTTSKSVTISATGGGGGTSVTVDSELSTTSENPVQNKVITQALNEKGTYSKPTGGIPKTDLASEVQTSLGKADTVPTLATEVDGVKSDIDEQNDRGYLSKNLLNPTLQTITKGGITCTNNGDGTYTFNGTASATIFFDIITISQFPKLEVGKTYKLVGCPSGGSESGYQIKGRNAGGIYDIGNGWSFNYDSSITDYMIVIRIGSGTVCNNLVFKPMLTTDLNATYDDFTPYAPSNTELQGSKADNSVVSDVWNASTTYAVGQYCIYNNSLWKCLVQHSEQTPTEGTYWTKVTVANEITSVNNSLKAEPVKLLDEKKTTGIFTLSKPLSLFKEIAITTLGSGNDYVCATVPVTVFKEINSITCVNSIDTRLAVLKYVNDTSINQAIVSNAHIYSIYGIK